MMQFHIGKLSKKEIVIVVGVGIGLGVAWRVYSSRNPSAAPAEPTVIPEDDKSLVGLKASSTGQLSAPLQTTQSAQTISFPGVGYVVSIGGKRYYTTDNGKTFKPIEEATGSAVQPSVVNIPPSGGLPIKPKPVKRGTPGNRPEEPTSTGVPFTPPKNEEPTKTGARS